MYSSQEVKEKYTQLNPKKVKIGNNKNKSSYKFMYIGT